MRPSPPAAYDKIAHLYDVDMALNMPFDDVGFYAQLSQRAGGRVLELGCGNGRILLELLKRGVDAYGVDRSWPMLAELRRKAGDASLDGRVSRMDVRDLAFSRAFSLVLCPYSLVTYMAQDGDAERMLNGIRHALIPQGRVVIDAFVPQTGVDSARFSVDYRRPHRGAVLTRAKRIASLASRLNRIERHYELSSPDGRLLEQIDTREDIRLFGPSNVRELLRAAGFAIESAWWDYVSKEPPAQPRFFTVIGRAERDAR